MAEWARTLSTPSGSVEIAMLQMCLEDCGIQRPAGGARDQLFGRKTPSLRVYVAPEPRHQPAKIAACEIAAQAGLGRFGGGKKLRRRHRTQRIGREIAEGGGI